LKKIAIFASGSGSNAEKIAEYFAETQSINIELILSNNSKAGVIERAKRLHIPVLLFDKKTFYETDKIPQLLHNQGVDLIVLAGFLWLIPENLIKKFPNRIINIHPALLPKYGGKGVWGHHVHEAVVANHETESGITIHYVNEHYDEGGIIFQAKCEVLPNDSPDDVVSKIHELEHLHFAKIVEKVLVDLGK
jgi:phosphoribosylglycinamide formyltransferase 1